MRLCVLGSGSSGNCIYAGTASTGLLIDAGLSARETLRRFEAMTIDPAAIRAVLLTHEHSDHIAGLAVLRKRLGADLYANSPTAEAVEQALGRPGLAWKVYATGFPFQVGDVTVEPFSVCHDAQEPVGFVIAADGVRVGVATDLGMATTLVREKFRDCHALILEANHDERLLREANRPWSLKQRIAGRQGHLSNRLAAELLVECAGPALTHVFLAHLSSECNRPELAAAAAGEALRSLGLQHVRVATTYADRPSDVWTSAP